jgi:hypothetical protein
MIELSRRWSDYSMQESFDLVDMWSRFPTSYLWRRKILAKFGYV